MTVRHAMFTIFPDTTGLDPFVAVLEKAEALAGVLGANPERVKYAVFQVEEAPSTLKIHFQGYLELTRPHRFAGIKAILGSTTAHIERRMGTRTQARDYCMKEDSRLQGTKPYEVFTWSPTGQGRRADIEALHSSLRDGATMRDISDNHFREFLQYQRGITAYRLLHTNNRRSKTRVTLYLGPPGTGKSLACANLSQDPLEVFWKPPNNYWFSGYDGHNTVVFDDFGGSWFSIATLLQIMDSHPLNVRVHQGLVPFVSNELHITCNYGPGHWYDWDKTRSPIQALLRRIDVLKLHSSYPVYTQEESEQMPEPVAIAACDNSLYMTFTENFPRNWEYSKFE